MRIVVIGGTGHIGGYLVPDLVRAGHEVAVIVRDVSARYRDDPAWDAVEVIRMDRDADGGADMADPAPLIRRQNWLWQRRRKRRRTE